LLILTLVIFVKRKQTQVIILFVMSLVFFWFASGWHVILLLFSTSIDWRSGNSIYASNDDRVRKRWLMISLVTNLSLLSIFKYLDFFIRTFNLAALKISNSPGLDELGLALPVGISFYTFQTMSYTIDIYRRKMTPYQSFIDFGCYASFFPQLVAGPIVRADEFKDQLDGPISYRSANIKIGLTLIVYGLFKKIVFADNLAIHANQIFTEGEHLGNIGLIWWASLCFGIQIYCDFSAYTNIALGSARLLGISLPENFKTPYAATSPQDFWRRWHISLSTWLRDYLYIPLGGSRHGKRVMIFALMTTMILGGLWHGASWNFVIWGLVHGLLLVAHRYFSKLNLIEKLFTNFKTSSTILSWVITQYLVFFTWLIFRIEDVDILFESMKTFIGIGGYFDFAEFVLFLPDIKLLTFALAIIFIIGHGLSGRSGGFVNQISKRGSTAWGLIIGLMLVIMYFLQPSESVDFIYFRF
jgi:alginate O-acetyltransferase complex protein AlgI